MIEKRYFNKESAESITNNAITIINKIFNLLLDSARRDFAIIKG